MSTFDIRTDAPGLLRSESLNVTLVFSRTGPSTGRISWNIPTPAAGCTAETQAYCGIVVTVDTVPAAAGRSPTTGTIYTADPTADTALFAGDKINTALVVGAYYNDRTTTEFDITGLKPNTPYYVSGYPVDCQGRYYTPGVHAFSQDYKNDGMEGTSGTQVVELNGTSGINATDDTGLLCGVTYSFDFQLGVVPKPRVPVDYNACIPKAPTYSIDVDGCLASTYGDLVNELNKQFSLLDNPPQGALPPNTNALYWNASAQKLFMWDGYQHVELSVIIQTTAPTAVVGTYWYDPTSLILKQWNGVAWVVITPISHPSSPINPICDTTYWFDGTKGYLWNGEVWWEKTTVVSTDDPSLSPQIPCGSYWYDTDYYMLYRWNDALNVWDTAITIQYHVDPNSLPIGTHWFNESSLTLNTMYSAGWGQETNVTLSETAPSTPAIGRYWYNPATEELKQWNGTVWLSLDVISYPTDPTQREILDLWWNTLTDVLSVWDSVNGVWNTVTNFYQQAEDPTISQTFFDGMLWYNPITEKLYVWQNICFKQVDYIDWPTDPTATIPNGTVWYNGTQWNILTAGVWVPFTPVVTSSDPSALPVGTYWFNPSLNTLQSWNGVAWVSVAYSSLPITPSKGAMWYDLTLSTLKTWDGTSWVAATPKVTVEIDCGGSLIFTDTTKTATSYISITDVSLFKSLNVAYTIANPRPGTDRVSDEPSYSEVGVGTDGSNDERLKLMNEIRMELGYPVVDVELTQEQLDFTISRALEEIRGKTAIAYKAGFFFMYVNSETQRYLLTNRTQGFHRIVTVMGVHRLTSSFLSSAHGAGVYGQIVLQHLYNMGTFDLLSYHTITEYVKLMEILFAGRVTFSWNEQSRELWFHHRFPFAERMVLIEATVERTEQDILVDRWCRAWIRRFAAATAREMLAEIRGKFASLPGAGGGITLNASDLRQRATDEKQALQQEIEDYIVDKPEEFGVATQFIFG